MRKFPRKMKRPKGGDPRKHQSETERETNSKKIKEARNAKGEASQGREKNPSLFGGGANQDKWTQASSAPGGVFSHPPPLAPLSEPLFPSPFPSPSARRQLIRFPSAPPRQSARLCRRPHPPLSRVSAVARRHIVRARTTALEPCLFNGLVALKASSERCVTNVTRYRGTSGTGAKKNAQFAPPTPLLSLESQV